MNDMNKYRPTSHQNSYNYLQLKFKNKHTNIKEIMRQTN